MKKRYCIFAAQFLPHMGGVENYTYNISKELIKRGNKVVVVTNNTMNSPMRENIEEIEVFRFPCFNFIGGRFPIMKINKEFLKIYRILKKQKYDIVLINARFYIHSLYAAKYAKKHNVQSICIEHGTSHLSVNNKLFDFIGGLYEHLHTAILKSLCKNYYGVSEACCEWSAHFGIKSKGVLYNAVDLDKIENLKENCKTNFRSKNYIDNDAVVIVFTGRLLKEKGIRELIAAVEKYNEGHKKIYLMIAGEGPEEDYVKEHESQYIIPLGRLQFSDIVGLLKESDIFCLPSVSEGFSTSALEAAACKCYIITTKRGGTKELVAGEEYGIVMDDNSIESIYSALVKSADNENIRKKGTELCYNRLKNMFTWEKTVDELESLTNKE